VHSTTTSTLQLRALATDLPPSSFDPLPQVEGGFRVVLADPPWLFRSNSLAAPGRNPRRHYGCETVEQLCELQVAERLAQDAVLFLWVPSPLMVIGAHLPLIKAWGFRATAMAFVWVKLRPLADPANFTVADLHTGTGFTTRKCCEFVVLGKRGRSLRPDAGVHEVIVSPRREHSRKPDELHARIERYVGYEGPFLEMFGRESRPGWTVWGDQAALFDPPSAAPSPEGAAP
jgi:N6-adenosine-specific RNA methylase IME4